MADKPLERFSDAEEKVIADLMAKEGLSRQAVLRQALRLYQLYAETGSVIIHHDDVPGCMGDE